MVPTWNICVSKLIRVVCQIAHLPTLHLSMYLHHTYTSTHNTAQRNALPCLKASYTYGTYSYQLPHDWIHKPSFRFLHNTNSLEYQKFRQLVHEIRRDCFDGFEEKKPEVKPEDKYEPEFSLEDDDSNEYKYPVKDDNSRWGVMFRYRV